MRKIGITLLCALILTLMFRNDTFAAEEIKPTIEVKSTSAYVGGLATVDIVLHQPKGLKTFEFQLNYDKAALELSQDNVKMGASVANWLYEYHVDDNKGSVRVAAVNGAGFENDQSVVLMQVTFKAKGVASVKELKLTELKGFTDINQPVELSSKAGTFTIKSSPAVVDPVNPVNPEEKPQQEIIIVKPSVDTEGNASAQVNDQEVAELVTIDRLEQIVVEVDVPGTTKSIEVAFSKQAVNQIANSGKGLVITSPLGDVELAQVNLAQFAGKDIVIKLEKTEAIEQEPTFILTVLANGQPVTTFDRPVPVKFPYTKVAAEVGGNVVVYRMEGIKKVVIPFAKVLDGKIVLATQQAGTFVVGHSAVQFVDTSNHWAANMIQFVAARELFAGVTELKFAPNGTMTRGMLVTVLGRLHGVAATGNQEVRFTDITADQYYAPYIEWASQNGIVQGTGNNIFSPDQAVTREEMAVMIANYMKFANLTMARSSVEHQFADRDTISTWSSESIQQMLATGILEGKLGNKFDAKGTATRAEVATVIGKIINYVLQ